MKLNKKYSGVIVPTVTPLTADHTLDHQAVEKMFENFSANRVMPFIIGTTGESASLTVELKQDFIKQAARLKKADTVLYAGIASNVFEESVQLAKFAFDNGVDVVAANLPSYYALSNDQIKMYFEQLANAVPGPLIIYNIPATTHMSIPLELIDELSYHPNIVGTKDSERSEERLQQSLALWAGREDFCHFLGWAAKSADALIGGSDGLIPSTGNLHPGIYNEMVQAVAAGDHAKAYEMQRLSDVLGDLYQKGRTLGQSLWALKVLMREAGLCQPNVMPPLQSMSADEEQALLAAFTDIINKEGLQLSQSLSHA
ncbi:dihydrodipicolinate synthase family protein [Aridibaculum aurantiacum]|uniref:dihydrodipicolinate synthase family protein n=1 Tax=Aridibaculum aurantiacum TaxID=2810307 RepID=UPI001A978557|nr:dihydrodipicolinate synthase family protein [Aridibaculum aurantiacum]